MKKDLEGLQTMRILARNMAFFLKCKEAGLKAGVQFPERKNSSSRTLSGNDCSLQKSWKIAALGEIVYGYVKRDAEAGYLPERRKKIASDHFIGTAWLSMLVPDDGTYHCPIYNVTFEPGARNNWHKHPGGQSCLSRAVGVTTRKKENRHSFFLPGAW